MTAEGKRRRDTADRDLRGSLSGAECFDHQHPRPPVAFDVHQELSDLAGVLALVQVSDPFHPDGLGLHESAEQVNAGRRDERFERFDELRRDLDHRCGMMTFARRVMQTSPRQIDVRCRPSITPG